MRHNINMNSNLNLHSIFSQNPDLLDFCIQTNILERVNSLLCQDTQESKNQAKQIIQNTDFPKDFYEQNFDQNTTYQTLIIGNGDVINRDHGLQLAKESGVDGIMIGRGIFKDPWAFLSRDQAVLLDTKLARINLLLEHLLSWEKIWQGQKNFPAMKKFVKMYINGFEGAADLRGQFMELNTAEQMIILCQSELIKT